MKKNIYLSILLSFFFFESKSNNLIGGDMNVRQISANHFIVESRLVKYCHVGQAPDSMEFKVFDIVTDSLYLTFKLKRSLVVYNQKVQMQIWWHVCREIYLYSDTILLPNNPNGYYFSYSNCCRYSNLKNTISNGLLWTCNIPDPAIVGRNSTPVFNDTITKDFFCVGYTDSIDFTCTDADGDSLVYSLINPYDNITFTPLGAKPFTLLAYTAGHSLSNILGPSSICSINSSTGHVIGKPAANGIYTFAVKCEEYRNGIKIGEVVKDFNIFSIPSCIFPSISENTLSTQIKIHPNPSNGIFKIEKTNSIENMKIEVYDIYGKVILSQEMNSNMSTIDLKSVAKGIYMVKITSNGLQTVKRIVVN